jgi:hypothetical protein
MWGRYSWEGGGLRKEIKVKEDSGWTSYTYINRTKKSLAIALNGLGGAEGEKPWWQCN